MDSVWLGIKIGFGIAGGITAVWVVYISFRYIAARMLDWKFYRANFTWEENEHVQGWLSRDPDNYGWILWDCVNNRMLRSQDGDGSWEPSRESVSECLRVGEKYWKSVTSSAETPPPP